MKENLISGLVPLFTIFLVASHLHGQANDAQQQLTTILYEKLSHKGKQPVHNIMLHISRTGYPDLSIGAGIVGRNDDPIGPNYQYRIASITKTFVATVVLQLVEQGLLDLDELALPHLESLKWLRFPDMHQIEGKSYADQITIRQLLNHTSGLADIFTDAETKFVLSVLMHRRRSYKLEDVADRFYKYKLHLNALNVPGEGYHYSDMNYMVLGLVAQEITGYTLHQLIRENILDPLHMEDTYFEYREAAHGHGKQIDSYYNKINLTQKVNVSYEWGGGGLISTNRDLSTFIEALFTSKLINRQLLTQMTDISVTKGFDKNCGFGIFRYSLGGLTFYGHGGFYGSLLLHAPSEQITIAINVGQANVPFGEISLLEKIIATVHN